MAAYQFLDLLEISSISNLYFDFVNVLINFRSFVKHLNVGKPQTIPHYRSYNMTAEVAF